MSFPVAESDNNCCPRANSCCFCISLRLGSHPSCVNALTSTYPMLRSSMLLPGVYLIALFDTAFSFLKVVGCILVLSQPQVIQPGSPSCRPH